MHELSIAVSIVDGVLEEAERRGGLHVEAVHLRLGPLSGVDKDALLFSWSVACDGTPLGESRLVIEETGITVFCDKCEAERQVCLSRMTCPECGGPGSRVVKGDELEISALEVAA